MNDRPVVLETIFLILYGQTFNRCDFMVAFTPFTTDTIASFPGVSLTQFTIALRMVLPAFERYSTADGIQSGYRFGWNKNKKSIRSSFINDFR